MALVGEVTLEVRADTSKVAGQLRRDLNAASRGSAAAGTKSGKAYSTAYVASAKNANKALASSQLATAGASGAAAGSAGGRGFSTAYIAQVRTTAASAQIALASGAVGAGTEAGAAAGRGFGAPYLAAVKRASKAVQGILVKDAAAGGAAAGAAGGRAQAAAQTAIAGRAAAAGGLGAAAPIATAGGPLGVAAIVTAGVAAVSIKNAADVEKGLAELITLTSLVGPEAEEQFGTFQKEVANVSRSTGKGQADIIGSFYNALSAGVPTEDVEGFVEATTKGAIAGLATSEDATALATTAINAFGLEYTDAGKVMDNFFGVVQGGVTTLPELASGFGNLAEVGTFGVSFEESAAAVSVLTKNLGKGSTAKSATAFRELSKALLAPSPEKVEKLNKVFNDAGFENAAEVLSGPGGLAEAISIVGDAADSPAELREFLGSAEALKAFSFLNSDDFANEVSRFETETGNVETAFEVMERTTGKAAGNFKTAINNALIELGTDALPAVATGFQALADGINSEGFRSGIKGFTESVGTAIGGIQAFASSPAGQALITIVGQTLVNAFKAAGFALRTFGNIVSAIGALFSGDFGGAFSSIGNIFSELRGNLTLLLAPFGVFGAISATIAGQFSNLGLSLGPLSGLFSTIGSTVSSIVGYFTSLGSSASGTGATIAGAFGRIAAIISPIVGSVVALVTAFRNLGNIAGAIRGAISGAISGIGPALAALPGVIVGAVAGIPGLVIGALVSLGPDIASTIGGAVTGAIGQARSAAGEVGAAILEGVLAALQGAGGQILDLLTPDLGSIGGAISSAAGGVTGAVGSAAGAVGGAVGSIGVPSLPFGGGGGGAAPIPPIKPEFDLSGLAEAFAALSTAGESIPPFKPKIEVDPTQFSTALAALSAGGGEGTGPIVKLQTQLEAAEGSLEALTASFGTGEAIKIPVIPEAADGALASLKNSLGGGEVAKIKVAIDVDKSSLNSLGSELSGQTIKGPKVVVDDFDVNAGAATKAASSAGKDISAGVASGVSGSAGVVNSAVSSVVSGAVAVGQSQAGLAVNIGISMSQGIAAGISGGAINAKIRAIVAAAIAAGKAQAEATSPSRATRREIGLPFSQGIEAGIEEGAPGINRAMKRVVKEAVKSARSGLQILAQGVGKDIAKTVNDAINSAKQNLGSLAGSLGGGINELIDAQTGDRVDAVGGDRLANAQQAVEAAQKQIAALADNAVAQEIKALQASGARLSVDRQRLRLQEQLTAKLDEQATAQSKIQRIEKLIAARDTAAPEIVRDAEQALLTRLRAEAADIPAQQQQSLDDFNQDQARKDRIEGLQALQTAQREALTEEQRIASERVAAIQKEVEVVKSQAELQKRVIGQSLADLTTGLNTGTITLKEYNQSVNNLLKRNQVTFGRFAKQVSVTAAVAFRDFLTGLRQQATAIGRGPRSVGSGNAAQVIDPLGILTRERSARLKGLQEQISQLKKQDKLDKEQRKQLTNLTNEVKKLRLNTPKKVTVNVNASVLDSDGLIKEIERRISRGLIQVG